MADMARKVAPGEYAIGMYRVVRRGTDWVAYGYSWGREEQVGRYRSLGEAHVSLTGEPRRFEISAEGVSGEGEV
jgi:hypothetical protein